MGAKINRAPPVMKRPGRRLAEKFLKRASDLGVGVGKIKSVMPMTSPVTGDSMSVGEARGSGVAVGSRVGATSSVGVRVGDLVGIGVEVAEAEVVGVVVGTEVGVEVEVGWGVAEGEGSMI